MHQKSRTALVPTLALLSEGSPLWGSRSYLLGAQELSFRDFFLGVLPTSVPDFGGV